MRDSDSMFNESLQAFGASHSAPEGLPADVRQRCLTALAEGGQRRSSILRRPALLSTVGLAVVLATTLGLLFPTNGGPAVQAATVLEKLSKQVAGTDVIEVRLDKVEVEEAAVNGQVFLAEEAVAGDVQITVDEAGEGVIEVDVSFGITEETGWVLVRKLRVPEAEAQVFIDMFLPRGVETLITLPPALVKAKLASGIGGGLAHLRELAGGHVTGVVKTLVESKSSAAAKTKRLADGTILVTVELEDEAAVKDLLRMVAKSMGQDEADMDLEHGDINELLGGAFSVVYDPKSETVRSFSVSGIHGIKGVITVSLQGGELGPALLNPARVTKPDTRRLDLGQLMNSLDGLKGLLPHD